MIDAHSVPDSENEHLSTDIIRPGRAGLGGPTVPAVAARLAGSGAGPLTLPMGTPSGYVFVYSTKSGAWPGRRISTEGAMPAPRTAKTIRAWRHDRHLTMAELGERVGVSTLSVWRWERARHLPRVPHLHALARALTVSIDAIALADDERHEADTAR